MSQWKFNNFETDIDFTDADFMEKFEGCYEKWLRNPKSTESWKSVRDYEGAMQGF